MREIDVFFQTNENIIIENSVNKFEIQTKSFIVIEVKNNICINTGKDLLKKMKIFMKIIQNNDYSL